MPMDAWLPVGYRLPDGSAPKNVLFEGSGWQVLADQRGGCILVCSAELHARWVQSSLVAEGQFVEFDFGVQRYFSLSSHAGYVLAPVAEGTSPSSRDEALAFARAFKATRTIDRHSPLQNALYVERISRLLPTYVISAPVADDIVLGYWLTGGAHVSVAATRRLQHTLSWLPADQLTLILQAAGFGAAAPTDAVGDIERTDTIDAHTPCAPAVKLQGTFELPGRPSLEAFINEHIIDIVQHHARYAALGIEFPSAVVLHGPPGCGKTYAIEKLIECLGWPAFHIDASSVASPYIHETSKKVADVFARAMDSTPSVLVIDEMEAFLADRDRGLGHHRVEEVAEFLRRIPEATKNRVLVVAMTNRIEMIDPAILRRGRFDHVIAVDYATEPEIVALLHKLLSAMPKTGDIDIEGLAMNLAGRPLSDVSFVVREAARLAARAGKEALDQGSLLAALSAAPSRAQSEPRRIGFY